MRDTNGLTAENSELKLKLQTTEQQVHLQDDFYNWNIVKLLYYDVASFTGNSENKICDLGTISRLLNATLIPLAVVFSWHDKATQFESFDHHNRVDANSEGHGQSRLEHFSLNSVKPKNSIWKKIKKIMPQKNYEEAWS
ncbi:hypothetical protein AgCh_017332 [Apium graveolens]